MTPLAVVEVVRPTSTSPLATAADVAAVAALAAVAVLLAMLLVGGGRGVPGGVTARSHRTAAVLATVALGLRVAAAVAGGADIGAVLVTRRVSAQAALLLAIGLLGLVAAPQAGLRGVERRVGQVLLGALALGAVVLGGPRAGDLDALWPALVAAVAAVGVATAAVAVLRARRPDSLHRPGAVVALLLVAAVVGWPAAVQPSGYTSFSQDLAVGDHLLQLTVAPAAPGDNEVHLYAFDGDGARVVLEGATITVAGQPPVRLVDAGIGHVLAFSLSLPQGEAWSVTVQADTPALDAPLVATTEVRTDG